MGNDRTFVVCRWLGLLPFNTSGKFSFVLSLYSFSLMALVISTYISSFSYLYVRLDTYVGSPGPLLPSVDIFKGLTSLSGFTVHLRQVVQNRRDFTNLIQFFGCVKSKTSYEFYILCVGIGLVSSSTIVALEGDCRTLICVLMVTIDLGLLIQFLILLQFLTFVQRLKREFSAVRNSIDIDRHEQLVTVGGLMNSLYGWQLLIFLLNFVASFIIAAFKLLMEMQQYAQTREIRCSPILAASIMLGFHLMELIYMCDVCSSTSVEAEAFNYELFNMMRNNDRLCNNKKLHLYVTMKQTIEFTACGFFRIGYPLVTSIIAAATTYLVIIIQFSLPRGTQ